LALKLATAFPRPDKLPGNPALAADSQHSRSVAAGVAFKSRVQVVGQADVVAGVAQRLIEVE
jgi:hypothetical protein